MKRGLLILLLIVVFIIDCLPHSIANFLASEKFTQNNIDKVYNDILNTPNLDDKTKALFEWDNDIVIWQNETYKYLLGKAYLISLLWLTILILKWKELGALGRSLVISFFSTSILTIYDWYDNNNTRDTYWDWVIFLSCLSITLLIQFLYLNLMKHEKTS